ncbi:hypothetical protein [Lentilactobacillus parafarraginis]|nr:hypothetical protein [Lentilactobacillus parafarraginis]
MPVKRVAGDENAAERRQLNGPQRVLLKACKYGETFRHTSVVGSVLALR